MANVDDCRKIVSETDKVFGTVHSLVNVAAFTERGTILSTTLENYERNFNVNTRAPFLLMQESIKIMIRDKIKGTIANVLIDGNLQWHAFLNGLQLVQRVH